MISYLQPVVAIILILILNNSTQAQDPSICPQPPNGLSRVNSLQWLQPDEIILLSIGEETENEYLQTWLTWDVGTGELAIATIPGVIEALQFSEGLGLYDMLLTNTDPTHLSLSPDLKNAVYMNNDRLYGVISRDFSNPIELSLLPENRFDLEVSWVSDEQIIVVIEPIYGESYEIFHICLDGSCFINISEMAGTFTDKPLIDTESNEVIFLASSVMFFYDLQSNTFTNQVSTELSPSPFLSPVRILDEYIYFIAFDASGVDLQLYSLDTLDAQIDVETVINPDVFAPLDWVMSENQHYMIFSTPSVYIQCY